MIIKINLIYLILFYLTGVKKLINLSNKRLYNKI
jgi:hypothetical protein